MSRVKYGQMVPFNQIPRANIQRSTFKRDWRWMGNFNHGDLIPFYYDEVVPGDTFHVRANVFARATSSFVVAPMADIEFYTFFFFVPYRIIWDNFVRFMGEQDDPTSSISYLMPKMDTSGTLGSQGYPRYCAYDCLGIPPMVPDTATPISSLPMRAINLIYNDFFRDQNTQGKLAVLKTDGPDPISSMPFRASNVSPSYAFGNYSMKINKHHEYFTSALPWPQKFTAPLIPIGGSAPVVFPTGIPQRVDSARIAGTGALLGGSTSNINYQSSTSNYWQGTTGLGNTNVYFDRPNVSVTDAYANISAINMTVNDIRQGFQIQRLLEANARGGTRYQEIVYSLFNVLGDDARFQRPELLGIGKQRFNVNPTVQTSATVSGQTPQANISAFGTTIGNKHGFAKSFVEHGLIIGFISSKADLVYQQGVERKWTRQTRYDLYFPQFAHLGEQGILNREIYYQGTAGGSADTQVFGYIGRFDEMRYKPSLVTNVMRSSDPTTLDVWHMAQKFSALPVLGYAFSQEAQPFKRLVAVQSAPDFTCDIFCNEITARPMPVRGIPGMIDHF